jgi:hypothetical protein
MQSIFSVATRCERLSRSSDGCSPRRCAKMLCIVPKTPMREQLVRFKYQVPLYRFVIRLASGTRIPVDAPDQFGRFNDQKVQFTDARGRSIWIASRGTPTRSSRARSFKQPDGR